MNMKWRALPDEVRVGLIAAAVVFFFSQGLPLHDSDYSEWLVQAQAGWGTILGRVFSPFTSDSSSWAFADRPMQVLLYKIFLTVFGTWGSAWFFVKSLVFGALAGVTYRGLQSFGVSERNSKISIALLTLSSSTISAVLWHADFAVYSELVLVATAFWFFPKFEKGKITSRDWFILLGCVYLGSKIKAEVRLLPVIFLASLALFRRDRFRDQALPLLGILAVSLPWSNLLLQKMPPFLPGATGWSSQTFRPLSFERIVDFLVRGVFDFSQPSASILAAGGVLFALAGVIYVGYRVYREKLDSPNLRWGFAITWFSAMLLACATLPPSSVGGGDLRYTLLPLLPATLLLGMGLQAAEREFGKFKFFRPALLMVLALQLGFHAFQDYRIRSNQGHRAVASEKLLTLVETKYPNTQFVTEPDFGQPGFHASVTPAISQRQGLPHPDFIDRFPAFNTVAASWNPSLDPRLTVIEEVSGCGASLFDLFVGCGPRDSAVLMRYLGTPHELTEAQNLDKAGKTLEARQLLEAYLQRDPGNYGVGFVLSLYTSKQQDFVRLEKLYQWLGEGFPDHPSVLYNMGVAKLGLSKFGEAAKYFEKAYALAPRDFSIGFNLADSYYRQGRKSRALATLNDLKQAYPNNPTIDSTITNWKSQ